MLSGMTQPEPEQLDVGDPDHAMVMYYGIEEHVAPSTPAPTEEQTT
jgi:hypothetical protein